MELTSNFINYIKNEKRYSYNTIKSYQIDIAQFKTYLEVEHKTQLLEADEKKVKLWLAEMLEKEVSKRTINRKISSLKAFYSFLIKSEILLCSPLQQIKSFKTDKRTPTFIRQKDINKFISEDLFNNSFSGIRDKCIIYILYSTGVRLNELINIKESDINNETIKVKGKRNKERYIPISPHLCEILNKYIENKKELNHKQDYLLITDKGNKMYEKFVFRKVKHYLSLVTTQKKKSPHVLRHTFATQMLNQGADLNAIKEILGHSNLSATQVYTHNSIEKLKGIYKQSHPRSGN